VKYLKTVLLPHTKHIQVFVSVRKTKKNYDSALAYASGTEGPVSIPSGE
jgi:hypothetical protein